MAEPATKEVVKIERNAIQEFEITPARVAEMAKEYLVMVVPEADNKAYAEVRAALTTCVRTRTGVDKRRKELGSDARKWISECNEAAKELIAPLAPVEAHLKAEIDREDDRKAQIKAAEAQKESDRISGIRGKINDIAQMVTSLNGLDSDTLAQVVSDIDAIELPPDEYMEFVAEANLTKHNAYIAAQEALHFRIRWENEEADRKALAERLAKQKADQDAEQARLDIIKAEQEESQRKIEAERVVFEARVKAENDRIEKTKQDEIDRKAREKREAEESKATKLQAIKDAEAKVSVKPRQKWPRKGPIKNGRLKSKP